MSAAGLLIELQLLCPGILAKPLSEFAPGLPDGIWTGQDGRHVMPDGLPMFCSFANGSEGYTGPLHTGFEEWLSLRGWWVEAYDGCTYFLLPESSK